VSVYLDTSVLAKRYVREARSDDFEAFLIDAIDATISSLAAGAGAMGMRVTFFG
jgi:predicted nucleic acid-binding protein